MSEDRIYYARRAAEQRDAAAQAHDDEVRRRHLELTELLSAKVEPAQQATF